MPRSLSRLFLLPPLRSLHHLRSCCRRARAAAGTHRRPRGSRFRIGRALAPTGSPALPPPPPPLDVSRANHRIREPAGRRLPAPYPLQPCPRAPIDRRTRRVRRCRRSNPPSSQSRDCAVRLCLRARARRRVRRRGQARGAMPPTGAWVGRRRRGSTPPHLSPRAAR